MKLHNTLLRSMILLVLLVFYPQQQAHAKLKIVTTVPDLAAIAHELGGNRVFVRSMASPTQDPHRVDARPHMMLWLAQAQLLLTIGMELEMAWLPTLITGSRNANIQPNSNGFMDLSQFVKRLQIPTMVVDRSQGDVHAQGNPHYLLAPVNALPVAKAIAARLILLDPAGKTYYTRRYQSFVQRLKARLAVWKKQLAPYKGTKVVTFHRAWIYFTNWAGFQIITEIEPKPGIAPTPSHVLQVLLKIRRFKVPLILQQSFYPRKIGTLLASRSKARFVVLSGGTRFWGSKKESYIQRSERLVSKVLKALKRK